MRTTHREAPSVIVGASTRARCRAMGDVPARYVVREKIMSADSDPKQEQQEVKTGTDLKLEALEKRMVDIEKSYQERIAELQQANRELWAAAHPAKAPDVPKAAEPEPAEDVGLKTINSMLGIKE